MSKVHPHRLPSPAHALIEDALLGTVALAGLAMLTFPAARGVDETFGWLPLWLSVLPLGAWAMARTLRLRHATRTARAPMARVLRWPTPHPTKETDGRPGDGLRRAA
jgi:hypothetical protein